MYTLFSYYIFKFNVQNHKSGKKIITSANEYFQRTERLMTRRSMVNLDDILFNDPVAWIKFHFYKHIVLISFHPPLKSRANILG